MHESKHYSQRALLTRLWAYYRPYQAILFSDLAAVLLLAAIGVAVPYFLKVIVDTAVPTRDFGLILRIALVVGLLALVKYGAEFYTLFAGHAMAARMERDMRRDFFAKLQSLSFSFFDERKTGELMSRLTNDIGKVSDSVNHAPEELLLAFATLAGSFAVLFSLHVPLALICLLPFPLMALYTGLLGGRILTGFEKVNDATAEINAKTENIIAGIRVVQSFAREETEAQRFGELNETNYSLFRSILKTIGWYWSGVDLLRDLARLGVIAAGGYFAVKGTLSLGSFVAFVSYSAVCFEPIERLTRTVEIIQRLRAGMRSFFTIMDEEPKIQERPDAKALPPEVQGRVGFEAVSFSYDGNRHVFRNLDLEIAPGTTVALVGPSGAGKTTFCNLIPRFYEPQSGCVRLDGTDVRELRLKDLRQAVGIVQQDVFLFAGTVRENIAYGREGAAQAELEAAARDANAHDFIAALPQGYETSIGEKGVKLSGGQKQRLAIARAFLKNPRILILDEATSSLDARSERMVQEALKRLVKGRTTLIIAHRLSTVREVDEIIVLTEEGIVQRGRHTELIGAPGLYRDLYATQDGADLVLEDEQGQED
jgi:ATP-binding cassette, subfamily B, bacterial